ncbi:MAG: DNA repair protein RadA [Xanthomonadales bacterium]|nr:DNA repair protein RadA [Xanthomonadales bacterium]
MRSAYQCQACGASFPKWQGQCSDCGEWNTVVEVRAEPRPQPADAAGPMPMARRCCASTGWSAQGRRSRIALGIGELDRVLGGGLVPGSVVLVGGDPGIGKSTLLMQALAAVAERLAALYVSGEESPAQLAARAARLGLPLGAIACLAQTRLEAILETLERERPALAVIDSIQTLWSEGLSAAPGSVSQVRECAAELVRLAKSRRVALFLVGHVTKEGGIAGPRVLEHMVDAVLYFEGESGSRLRVLRALKNRYGAVNELGVFAMGDRGLREVPNPSALFLAGRATRAPGSAVLVTREGTRPLLVEVQALVDQSPLGTPRRVALGLDGARLAMLLAVLHRHGGLPVYAQDVFVNLVGGLRVSETAADLAVLLAVASSLRDRALPSELAVFGEAGLSGEIRPVAHGEERIREARQHGFATLLLPRANLPRRPPSGLTLIPVERIGEALERAFG